jgi:putative transposase
MLKSYKYCLLPSDNQKEKLKNFFGICRFAYNIGLETKNAVYSSAKINLSYFDLCSQMVDLKKEYKWISQCPAKAILMSLNNLDKAYKNFFKGASFPKFKNKHSRQSIQFPQNTKLDFPCSKIRISNLGWVDLVIDRPFKGEIKTVTVIKTNTNKYFVSILVDNQKELPKKKIITEQTAVGIDLGIKTLAILSDGTQFENPKWFRAAKANLRRQQRSLSRKIKGSNNREKQRLVVARCHEKISNQRKDYLQKITTRIIKDFDTICIENLNVSGMMKNRRLASSISEVSWSSLTKMLKYKSDWYGKNLITIGRFEPSSKMCSVCGTINTELRLKDREWRCNDCGTTHDRDTNAAINIKKIGLRNKPVQANVI